MPLPIQFESNLTKAMWRTLGKRALDDLAFFSDHGQQMREDTAISSQIATSSTSLSHGWNHALAIIPMPRGETT